MIVKVLTCTVVVYVSYVITMAIINTICDCAPSINKFLGL